MYPPSEASAPCTRREALQSTSWQRVSEGAVRLAVLDCSWLSTSKQPLITQDREIGSFNSSRSLGRSSPRPQKDWANSSSLDSICETSERPSSLGAGGTWSLCVADSSGNKVLLMTATQIGTVLLNASGRFLPRRVESTTTAPPYLPSKGSSCMLSLRREKDHWPWCPSVLLK